MKFHCDRFPTSVFYGERAGQIHRAMPFLPAYTGPGVPDATESQAEVHAGRFKSQGSSEAALNQQVNQKVKNLIQKLGEAIHESVSESEDIAGVVKNIRDQGFDVLLMLEATIGLNEVEASPEDTANSASEAVQGSFTTHDLNFLKSLRITLSDSEEHPEDISRDPPAGSIEKPSAEA